MPREVITTEGNGPFAMKTDLGWGVVGLMSSDPNEFELSSQSGSRIVLKSSTREVLQPCEVAQLFVQDDNSVFGKGLSVDDSKFLQIMDKGICVNEGQYQMPLPLRDPSVSMENNKSLAWKRLKSLVKRFEKDSEYYGHYVNFMEEIFAAGYAERVPSSELAPETPCYYLAHHGVYNPAKPGKVRVVMDASAKYHGKSLNDYLFTGPDMINGLLGVLWRFRKEKDAVTCDIKGMFQQFKVSPEHRNFLRFMWFENNDYNGNVVTYRSTVHLFGLASSPAVANYGLKRAASDQVSNFGPEVINFIHRDFYVDDGLTSVPSESDAIHLIKSSIELCANSGLTLHKFVSNSRRVIDSIDPVYRADKIKDVNLDHVQLPVERALGVSWCIESDALKFRVVVKEHPFTRRGLLSTVCSIFDPLGLIAPVVLQGKLLLQSMCKDKLDWDEPLPDHLKSSWQRWLDGLPALESLAVPRCYKPNDFGAVSSCELHHFSDACCSGLGQCTYLKLIDTDGKIHCSLVMAKARVAPVKSITIPRLELNAAVLSVTVSEMLNKELSYETISNFYWTDSKIVLGFLANESKRFHIFVANRVQVIHDASDPQQWHHVSTKLNPADLASRGCTGGEIEGSNWLRGPSFLWKASAEAGDPGPYNLLEEDESIVEIRKVCLASLESNEVPVEFLPVKYSSWLHAKRVIAICIRFVENLKGKMCCPMSVSDLQGAELYLVKQTQKDCFTQELKDLVSMTSVVKHKSSIAQLDPFIDEVGLLRVGGRIRNGTFPLELKHPLILPRNHFVSELVVRHGHETVGHAGKGMTVNAVRTMGFWVVGLTSLVSSMIHKCSFCRKQRGALLNQKMSDLPQDRLDDQVPPFTHIGVDYFGPFYIREGRKELKRYGVLFTCLVVRAVHIETAQSLDTDSFINALRRFLSIRGPIRTLRCDRGTNFIGAIRALTDSVSHIDESEVTKFLSSLNCDYVTNFPSASHQGGAWERQIRSVRNTFNSLLSAQGTQLNDEALRTLMYEAANIINSRPLTVEDLNDPTSLIPITPNHLIQMKSSIVLPPPGEFDTPDVYSKKRWKRVQYMVNQFWQRWRKAYLNQLQNRAKWQRNQRDLQVGDVVIISDESIPRSQWKLGRVFQVYPGSDGKVRKVKLLVGDPGLIDNGKRTKQSKFLDRPIHKLVLLVESEQ